MTPEEWRAIKEILNRTLELPDADRASFLDQACGGDADLKRRIASLIEADQGSWSLLESPAAAASSLAEIARTMSSGERIGSYEILDEIGHGGMGVVYLARRADEEFDKRVAIKTARVGLSDDLFRVRFRTERQIVASLDHPNIARLLDGGTAHDGQPYLVMEYVEGEPLLEFCGARGLETKERLGIFLEVCAAVQYAHQHLIVHRDLKPANILVTKEGTVKLLDFGIAKLIAPEAAGTDQTGTLFRLLTPDYASPEQLRGEPVTTASDIYALGVVLYELLTGQKPYRVADSSPAEMIRIVCETEPVKPSAAVVRGETSRTEDTQKLRKALSGDLDTIVLKAMRKEPSRRYASVGELALDIRRHLEGLPVSARRDSFGYRAAKFVRRHRAAMAAASIVLIALVAGLLWNLREARRARAAEARAERRFNDVRRLANSFLFEIHDQIKDLPGSTPARQLLVKRALEYLDGLAKERGDDPSLVRELAAAYQKVGDVQGNPYQPNLGDVQGGFTSYRKAINLLLRLTNRPGAVAEDKSALAGAYLSGCGMALVLGKASVAADMSTRGLALRQGLVADSPGDRKRKRDLSTGLRIHAYILAIAGRHAEAADALRRQAAILRELLQETPEDAELRGDLGQNRYVTGLAMKEAGDQDAARAALLEAEGLQRSLMAANPNNATMRRSLFWSLTDLANLFLAANEFGPSRERYQQALEISQSLSRADPTSRDGQVLVAITHVNLGELEEHLGDRGAALRHRLHARLVLETLVKADPSNAWVASILADLYIVLAEAKARTALGNQDSESCDLYRKGLSLFERLKASGRLPAGNETALEKARDRLKLCPERFAAASP